jgi:hypothetical protein
MRRALISSFCAGIALAGLLAAMILTTDRALPAHFPRGVEACFGRVYDRAFLAAHPSHRFTELYVFRDFATGGPREDLRQRATQIAADRASEDDLSVTIMPFTVAGLPIARDTALLEGGLDLQINPPASSR